MDEDQNPTKRDIDAQAAFTKMAGLIGNNLGGDFGGAVVIFPPAGEPVEMLMLDNQQKGAMFWSNIKTLAEIAISDLDREERRLKPGYRG